MPVKKLVLIPAAKWDHLVRQYNLETTSDIQELSLPIPNLKDDEAPLAPPTPLDAYPPPDHDAAAAGSGDAPEEEPARAGDDAMPANELADDPGPGDLTNDAPPLGARTFPNARPVDHKFSTGMAYKCDDGKKPQLVKVPKDKRRKVRVPKHRLKSQFINSEQMKALRDQQKASYKEDRFNRTSSVANKPQWNSRLQKRAKQAVAARKKAQKKVQNNIQQQMNDMKKESRHLRHTKKVVDV